MPINEYNQQQLEAILIVREHLGKLPQCRMSEIKERIRKYLRFRTEVEGFQARYLSGICTQKCFTSQISACCNREGIATFFADVVINVLLSSGEEVDTLIRTLLNDRGGVKCVYLSESGCLWRLKPIVCEMYLCKYAKESILYSEDGLHAQWEKFRRREKYYTWPSRPVLFDRLEEIFIHAGYDNSLMYFHHSPGLIRVKNRHLESHSPKRT
jgi:hypothetical protein